MRRALALFVLGYALSGCSVTALAERERSTAVNECTSASDCRAGGFCSAGMCQSSSASFVAADEVKHLLFELTPITTPTGFGGKLVYLDTDIPRSGEFDLAFNGFSNVEVKVMVPELCRSATYVSTRGPEFSVRVVEGTVPARVTLIPSFGRLGLTADEYRAEVNSVPEEINNTGIPHSVTFPVAMGAYDVYVEPRALSPSPQNDALRHKCTLPPQLLLSHPLSSSSLITLPVGLPSPAPLALQVRLPTAYSLAGWKLDIVEPQGGRLISTTFTLTADQKSPFDLPTPLYYYPVWLSGTLDADTSATELVRLSPPAGVLAPTFLYQRKSIEIFDLGSAVIEPPAVLPLPVTVEGQVLSPDGGSHVSAEVLLTATEILGVPPGTVAAFERRVVTDEAGRFSDSLLPGKYRVRAVPSGGDLSEYAAAEAEWEIAENPRRQSGRAIQVRPAIELSGRAVIGWNSSGAFGADVVIGPSALEPRASVLERALGGAPLPPRYGSSLIGETNGAFRVSSEFGKLDFFVRPPQASRLPWFVMAGVDVPADTESTFSIGAVSLPLPLLLEGDVRIVTAPTINIDSRVSYRPAQSLLRAYVLLDADGRYTSSVSSARAALPIAETRIDANDRYTLFVPGSLNVPVKTLN